MLFFKLFKINCFIIVYCMPNNVLHEYFIINLSDIYPFYVVQYIWRWSVDYFWRIKNQRVLCEYSGCISIDADKEAKANPQRRTINRYGMLRNRESTTLRKRQKRANRGVASSRVTDNGRAHEQPLTRAWNQAPARTSARLGGWRTIRIDILINERRWVRWANFSSGRKGERWVVKRRGNGGTNVGRSGPAFSIG